MDAQALFESIADSAVLLDKAGRIINWNAGASSLFGYTKSEAIGRSINFIYHSNYPFQKLIFEQKKWQEDTSFVRKNGIKGWCRSSLSPFIYHEPQKFGALLIHHNILSYKKSEETLRNETTLLSTQLQQSVSGFWASYNLLLQATNLSEQLERKLSESELRFHLLAENATDVISRHSLDGVYLYVSPASKTSIGYAPEELVGKNIYKLMHYDDIPKFKKTCTQRKRQITNKPILYRIKRKDGEFRWFESNMRLVTSGATNRVTEIQLASRDITDRVLDKKARLRGQQLAHVFRLSTMEEMASGIAHEISQPLGAIVNYTRGCVRHLQNTDHNREQLILIMEKAAGQAERAGEIVQRLKNFFCKGQLVKTQCKINNVIRETVSLIKNELSTSQTKIDFEFDKTTPFIYIDKIQIQQVLLNLLQNAIEAMQEHNIKEKRIRIHSLCKSAELIEVTIADTGNGFSKEIAHQVFTPFFTTKAHGRGMGLAICRSIIEAHGGQFTINPNTTNNSWIRFSLPIYLAKE